VYSVKAHREIINAIDGVGGLGIGEGAPEIVTAGRDGIMFSLHCYHYHYLCHGRYILPSVRLSVR